jgi:adenylate cyclase
MSGSNVSDLIGKSPNRRKLIAAVMVGYSRLIGLDDAGTLERLQMLRRKVIDPAIEEHGGRIVQTGVNSLLIVFDRIDGAVRCAVRVQQQVPVYDGDQPPDRAIRFRVGINVGDAIVGGTDLHGDAVNVAARLQAECPPGGICVSRSVREHVHDRPDLAFEELGALNLKNIARPVEAFVLKVDGAASVSFEQSRVHNTGEAALLPDRPSIAVLAFTNISNDLDQEYFSDGIASDIITELSRSRWLFVIARNSSFKYKGRAVDVKQVARELGVRYILEGSVRHARCRVRVTAELIEATTGGHVWAERYDRDHADIFAVQDEITNSVSAAIKPALERSERERVVRKPADSLDAWESYHRGMWHFSKVEATENEKARSFFQRSIELDRQFARPVAALALTYLSEITLFRPHLRPVNLPLALEHSVRAVTIDATDATGHAALARALWMSGRHTESLATAEIAVSLEPNSPAAHGALGGARLWGGFARRAIEPLRTAMRLSPLDPLMPLWLHFMARAHYWSGEYQAAISVASQVRQSFPAFRQPYNTLIAALGQVGRVDDAHAVMADGLALFGDAFRTLMLLPLDDLRELRPEDREHVQDGLRKAGWQG